MIQMMQNSKAEKIPLLESCGKFLELNPLMVISPLPNLVDGRCGYCGQETILPFKDGEGNYLCGPCREEYREEASNGKVDKTEKSERLGGSRAPKRK